MHEETSIQKKNMMNIKKVKIEYKLLGINKFSEINQILEIACLEITYRNGLIGRGVDFTNRNKIHFPSKTNIIILFTTMPMLIKH